MALFQMKLFQHTRHQYQIENKKKKNMKLMNPTMMSKARELQHSNKPQSTKIIKKIIHIYQLQYINRKTNFGLGDFLRGSFCLLQICNKYGIQFDIDVSNHPMSNYVEGQLKNHHIDYNNIEIESCFETTTNPIKDYKLIMKTLKTINTENYYTCSNTFPPFEIKQPEIEFIKSRLQPNMTMKTAIEQEMNELNLISNHFSVIHIRSGDNFLLGNNILIQDWIKKMFDMLSVILYNNTNKYLILSDNNQLKQLFKKYDNCVVQIKPITHLGEQRQLKDEEVKNTMLDFYLMSQSKHIYAVTVYGHGTGFSKWCSVLHNIPYDIKVISV